MSQPLFYFFTGASNAMRSRLFELWNPAGLVWCREGEMKRIVLMAEPKPALRTNLRCSTAIAC